MSSFIFVSSSSSSDVDECKIFRLRSLFVRDDDLLFEDFLRECLIVFFFFEDDEDLLLLLLLLLLETVLDLDLARLLRLGFDDDTGSCRRDLRLLLAVVLLCFRWRERLSDCLLLLRLDFDHDVSESESEWETSVVRSESE